jgi:hypothetical protein
MRACEGCRRRKIKCDAATTNTWPCSACIKLKLHCVRPNGFDSGTSETTATTATATTNSPTHDQSAQQYFAAAGQDGYSHAAVLNSAAKGSIYQQPGFTQSETNLYPYGELGAVQHNMHYTTVPPPVAIDDTYATSDVYSTPGLRHDSHSAGSPSAFSTADSQAADLSNLLGSLKVNEAGTGMQRHALLACSPCLLALPLEARRRMLRMLRMLTHRSPVSAEQGIVPPGRNTGRH